MVTDRLFAQNGAGLRGNSPFLCQKILSSLRLRDVWDNES